MQYYFMLCVFFTIVQHHGAYCLPVSCTIVPYVDTSIVDSDTRAHFVLVLVTVSIGKSKHTNGGLKLTSKVKERHK